MPKRKRKKFARPRTLFDKARIKEEGTIQKAYGLKNKKEIWKAGAAIERLRNQAKKLITAPDEEKESFLNRLRKKGFNVENIADVLGLTKEDWLKRRLQTIVVKKRVANTVKQARQFITHKLILVEGRKVDSPSYFVNAEQENQIELDKKITIKIKKTKAGKKDEKEKERKEFIEAQAVKNPKKIAPAPRGVPPTEGKGVPPEIEGEMNVAEEMAEASETEKPGVEREVKAKNE